MTHDPLALDQAAAAARLEACGLAAARLEPGMPLSGYLQPLQNFTHAIVCTMCTASRLADLAVLAIIDPEAGADADHALKNAERHAGQAGDQAGHTFGEIRRALRAVGQTVPYLGGLERLRRYKTTADALAALSAEAEKAVRAGEPLALRRIESPAANLADVLGRLEQAAGKLRAGIDDAYTRLPGNTPVKASRATDRLTQVSRDLAKASGYVSRAAGVISAAITEQRKVATW